MAILYDTAKNQENIRKHGLSFGEAELLDWANAVTVIDDRFDYGEERFISYGMLNYRLHAVVWTPRNKGEDIRVISFRKANAKERKRYE